MIKNLFFIAIAVALLVIAAMLYFQSYSVIDPENKGDSEQTISASASSETLTNVENKSPRFEFYTVLAETPILMPEEDEQKNNRMEIKNNKDENVSPDVSVSPKQYVLQIASFRYREEAEKLRGQLFNQGFDVHIEEFNNNDVLWYRVRWGPFPSLQAAKHALDQMNAHHISPLLQRTH